MGACGRSRRCSPGATTPGERVAAEAALTRIKARLARRSEPPGASSCSSALQTPGHGSCSSRLPGVTVCAVSLLPTPAPDHGHAPGAGDLPA